MAYGIVGMLAGAFGSIIIQRVQSSWLNYLPWVLVIFFLLVAFRADRFFPKPIWLAACYQRFTARLVRLEKPVAAAMIGLASPLLPW